jgi:hypothetical protein
MMRVVSTALTLLLVTCWALGRVWAEDDGTAVARPARDETLTVGDVFEIAWSVRGRQEYNGTASLFLDFIDAVNISASRIAGTSVLVVNQHRVFKDP